MYTSNRTVQTRWGWLEIVIVLVMASLIGVAALFLSAPTTARAQGGSVYLPLVSTGQGAGTMAPDNVVPNEYIVVLRDFHVSGQSPSAVTVADAARTLTDVYGGEILYTYESALRGFAVTTTDEAAAAMAGDPAVALVGQTA